MITIKNVSKVYKKGNVHAVTDASFTIRDNEIFALLGPNGAGKTTCMRMISTLLAPTQGEILYDGICTVKNEIDLRRKIGFLTNEVRLDGQFSPNQSARYFGRLYGLSEEEVEKNKKELFQYFGISEYADRKYEAFSTGMKQKTSLAICLIHDPDVILFDEPTNGLDILTQRLVEEYILLLKNRGKCIIISTHLMDVVEYLADRIGVMVDGRSVFCGSRSEMLEAEKAQSLSDAFISLYIRHHTETPPIDEKHTKRTGILPWRKA